MATVQIVTPFNIDIEFELAEFHKRLLAYIIDFILLICYIYSMLYFMYGNFEIRESSLGFILLVLFIPTLFYTLLTELWMNGQTIGKRILKIKVVSLDGDEATLGQYLLRWFLRFYEWGFIVMLFFGLRTLDKGLGAGMTILIFGGITSIIIIGVTPKNQRIGDLAAGTVVVNTRSKMTIDDTIFKAITNTNYVPQFPDIMRLSDRDINTIKNVLTQSSKRKNHVIANKISRKVKDVLKIQTNMDDYDFLEKLLEDYNYLATKE